MQSIVSKSGSSARVRTTRCPCTPCSFGRRTQSLTPLAHRISHFQRGRLPGEPADHGHGLYDEHRPEPGGQGACDSGHGICRGDKKGVFTVANYFAPKQGVLDALLGDGGQGNRPLRRCSSASAALAKRPSPPIRSVISSATTSIAGAMTASSTSKAAATRKRSTSHRRADRISSRRCVSAPCWKTWFWTTTNMWTSRIQVSPRIPGYLVRGFLRRVLRTVPKSPSLA